MLRFVVLICLIVIPISALTADDFSIDSFRFEWTAAKSGKTSLLIVKTEQDSTVVIRRKKSPFESFVVPIESAEKISDALSNTAAMEKQLKGTKLKSEDVEAGECTVTFGTSSNGEFFVAISKRERNKPSPGVTFDRDAAIEFAPHLQKVKKMIDFVDEKIKF